jgi:autotransporter-associated beta strand protein
MNTASLSIAAIEVTSARTRSLTIGNSSTGSAGTLTLNGATIGSVSNVVVRNASNSLLTLQNTAVSGSQNMTVVLANSTNNVVLIDGAGGVTISSVITGTNSLLTLQGSGSGNLTLSGANTYSGGTTISSRTLIASNASALGTGTVSINGGNLATTISNLNTGNVNLISGELTLNGSGVGTLTLASGADIVWTGGTWNLSILNLGSFDRVLGGGVGSAFAISNTILALSGTVSNGSYEILTGFETGVGSFGSITGLAEGQSAFTNIAGGVLTLTVVPEPHEYALAIAGLLGLLVVVRRVRQSRCLS